MKSGFGIVMLVGLFVGCTVSSKPGIEDNAVGVVRVEVTRSEIGVQIVGYDGNAAQVARVVLFRGEVDYAPDIGDPTQRVNGQSLTIKVGDDPDYEHVSPGKLQLTLPMPTREATAAFLDLAIVRDTLAREGIELAARPAGDSVAAGAEGEIGYDVYGTNQCSICTYARTTACGTNQCAANAMGQSGPSEVQWVCCSGSQSAGDESVGERLCTGNPGGSNDCGAVGPNGCSICWSSSWSSWCGIFYDQQDVCSMQWF